MGIRKIVKLYCDDCGKEYSEDSDEARCLREYSRDFGWKRKRVENGSLWDLCPLCYREHIAGRV